MGNVMQYAWTASWSVGFDTAGNPAQKSQNNDLRKGAHEVDVTTLRSGLLRLRLVQFDPVWTGFTGIDRRGLA